MYMKKVGNNRQVNQREFAQRFHIDRGSALSGQRSLHFQTD